MLALDAESAEILEWHSGNAVREPWKLAELGELTRITKSICF